MTTTAVPQVAGFELGRLLGAGATSEVWEAVRVADGRRVAVKVCSADPEAADAAAREAAVTSRVAAEHLLAVEACLPTEDGRVALVMPLMRGGSLSRLVAARGHLTPGEVVTVLAPVAATLGRLHAAGVVHGDVSPGNVLLDLDGRPVLADLGLGRVVGEEPAAVWGTEGHLAPEVLLGGEVSPASDVYAVGALGWLCLTGEVPGPPGLRPELAAVSKAGEEATALVAVLASAVQGRPADRPDADALAGEIFGCAPALPLHLVDGEDEVTSVTYRLRAAAGSGPTAPEVPQRRGRHRPGAAGAPPGHGGDAGASRRRVLALRRGLSSIGGAARPTVGRRGISGPVRPVARPGLLVVGAALAGAVVLALLLGVGHLVPGATAGPRPVVAGHAPSPPAPGPSASGPAGGPRASGAARTPSEIDRALVQRLARSRAEAWRAGDPALLGDSLAAGPLLQRDTEGISVLRASGRAVEGLEYTVGPIRVLESGARGARVRTRLGTSAYDVVGPSGRSSRAAAAPTEVTVSLEWTGAGWRIVEVVDRGPTEG